MSASFDTCWNDTAGAAFASVFGDTVSLKRGAVTTTSVTAQKFLGERTINYEDGGTTKFTGCDWIIAKADYQFSGVVQVPRSGDRIIESDGSEWECTPIEGLAEASEQPGGLEWLVMTKRVKQ